MFESSDVATCTSCGREYKLPCKGWNYCWDCFIDPVKAKKTAEYFMAKIRKEAHKDKEWLENILDLPYQERIVRAWNNGHEIAYQKEGSEV